MLEVAIWVVVLLCLEVNTFSFRANDVVAYSSSSIKAP